MNCKNCGNFLDSNAVFCSKCGGKVENQNNVNSLNNLPNNNINNLNNNMSPMNNSVTNSIDNINSMNSGINNNSFTPSMNLTNNQPNMMSQNTQIPGPNPNQVYGSQNTINNQSTNINQSKKNNSLFTILIIVCVVIIIGLGVFIGIKLFSNNNETANDNQNINSNENNNSSNNSSVNNENVSNDITEQNNDKITLSGYTFTLPNYLKYDNGVDHIYAANNSVTMIFNFFVTNYPYDSVKTNFEQVKQNLIAQGAEVGDAVEVNSYGRNYILITIKIDGYYAFYYITKIDNYYVAEGVLQGATEDDYKEGLKVITDIINSAKTTSSFSGETTGEFKSVKGYKGKLVFDK